MGREGDGFEEGQVGDYHADGVVAGGFCFELGEGGLGQEELEGGLRDVVGLLVVLRDYSATTNSA